MALFYTVHFIITSFGATTGPITVIETLSVTAPPAPA